MLLRRLLALAAAASLAAPALAQPSCLQNEAVYTEKDNGYVLTFREPRPWEGPANMMAVLDLAFPDGKHVWGWIHIPNGTSHDRIALYDGCHLSGQETPSSTEEEFDACRVWSGVALALENDDIAELQWHDGGPAARTLLLPDLGPTIRYSGLVLSPGDEPHDVFTLTGCAPG